MPGMASTIKERYFLVSFAYSNTGTNFGVGIGTSYFACTMFPSFKYLQDSVRKKGFKDIGILSIFEFKSKEDFDSFSSDEAVEE